MLSFVHKGFSFHAVVCFSTLEIRYAMMVDQAQDCCGGIFIISRNLSSMQAQGKCKRFDAMRETLLQM